MTYTLLEKEYGFSNPPPPLIVNFGIELVSVNDLNELEVFSIMLTHFTRYGDIRNMGYGFLGGETSHCLWVEIGSINCTRYR